MRACERVRAIVVATFWWETCANPHRLKNHMESECDQHVNTPLPGGHTL